ncbi:MAG: RHS repeat-associated core domain-containing protein, partial [bacterium]|nr:RHS repeat-associated core domain-containing protein [bacterium]
MKLLKPKLISLLIFTVLVFQPSVFVLAQETTTTYPSKYYNIDSNGKVTKHIFANGIEIATIEGTGLNAEAKYIHTDNLSSTNVVTDSNGVQVEVLDYFPFGGVRLDQKASSISEQRKFIGQEYDEETKLNYLNARYYDSSNGKFMSQDPMFWSLPKELLLDPQQQNSYSYARNNPINLSDPSGLKAYFTAGFVQPFSSRTTSSDPNVQGVMSWMKTQFGSAEFYSWPQRDNTRAFRNAAQGLADRVISEYKTGEFIDLVAHSDGGIVSGKAAQILEGKGYNVRNLVIGGTPIRSGDFNLSGVDNVVMSYNTDDGIQTKGGGLTSASALFGTGVGALAGPPGAALGFLFGSLIGWGEIGPARRTLPNASNVQNVDTTKKAGPG